MIRLLLAAVLLVGTACASEVADPTIMDREDCAVMRDAVWPIVLEHDTGYSVWTMFDAMIAGAMFGAAIILTVKGTKPRGFKAQP